MGSGKMRKDSCGNIKFPEVITQVFSKKARNELLK